MLQLQAYKYELKPNGEQQRPMRHFAGACHFVFNQAPAIQKANHEARETFIGYVAMAKQLTAWRDSAATGRLSDAPAHPLQHALKDLEVANKNFFGKRAEFPRLKKKGRGDSFLFPDAKQFKIDAGNSRVCLPKFGWLCYRNSRDMLGTAKNITVSSNGGKWFVSIQIGREVAEPVHPSTSIIGIDAGIARFACVERGYANNADLVGAVNILAAGHAVLACGGMVRSGHPVKQEPAEATRQGFAPVSRRRNRLLSVGRGCQSIDIKYPLD